MYLPNIFAEKDMSVIKALVVKHPLGVLISLQNGKIQANHLPFVLISQADTCQLITHIAKANPVYDDLDNQEVLVVFTGEQGYVSPNWYPSKQQHHRHVPTWNYQVVHMRGVARVLTDKKSLMFVIGQLTKQQEGAQPKPWKIKDAPADFVDGLLEHIVALRIDVTDIQAKSKLSQNRDMVDFLGVIDGLTQSDGLALAQVMANAKKSN
ncbi:MAG: FMN-binding negative transcriptional regulator [Moraxella sp.]|nr:FMN-binding negative transcriptional regulator [Moraxella sp.]